MHEAGQTSTESSLFTDNEPLIFKTKEIQQTEPQILKDEELDKLLQVEEGDYHEKHFLYWLVESSHIKFTDNFKSKFKLSNTNFTIAVRRSFLCLWILIKMNKSFVQEKQYDHLLRSFRLYFGDDNMDLILSSAEETKRLENIVKEFMDDGNKIRGLIQNRLWKKLEFMKALQGEVKTVPLTKSNLLNRTYRRHSEKVVEALKLMRDNC